jgi:putative ABC transport system ATP-binding protein
MRDIVLEFQDVSFAYAASKPLFKGLSIVFETSRFYIIKGASGCGKSTFLRLINRLEEPFSGEIRFKGRPVANYDPPLLRRSILYVQQVPQVLDLSVRDNLLLPFCFQGNRNIPRPDDQRMQSLMERMLLEDVNLDESAKILSTGQQQRICLIRGLLLAPDVVLLDEPTSALDADSCLIVQEMVENLCHEHGITVLMVSHRGMDVCTLEPVLMTIEKGKIFQ